MRSQTFILLLFISSFLNAQEAEKEFIVKDSTQYDSEFIRYYRHLEDYGVLFTNDSIIIGGDRESAIIIPTDLPLKQNEEYETVQGDTTYTLVVNRQNYTNVHFSIIGTKKGEVVFERINTAILESSFQLGSEGVYERNEYEVFGMNDYNISDHGDHKLLIPVGTLDIINYYEPGEGKEIVLLFDKKQ